MIILSGNGSSRPSLMQDADFKGFGECLQFQLTEGLFRPFLHRRWTARLLPDHLQQVESSSSGPVRQSKLRLRQCIDYQPI